MARKYAVECKESIIARMLLPRSESVPGISKETGIPVDTLYTWRIQYRNNRCIPAITVSCLPGNHDSEEKLLAIMETASFSERDICSKFITPAILKSGWTQSQFREEVKLTDGRVAVRGKMAARIKNPDDKGGPKRADYVLYRNMSPGGRNYDRTVCPRNWADRIFMDADPVPFSCQGNQNLRVRLQHHAA